MEFDDRNFVGRAALETADKFCRTWGMRVRNGVAQLGRRISIDGKIIGQVCSAGYSPYQKCGVCIVRLDDPTYGPGTNVKVEDLNGNLINAEVCSLPMYDTERLIPRGKLVDIPINPSG